jgi:RNase H-fold protein (predicted Holliday junction resolvase)
MLCAGCGANKKGVLAMSDLEVRSFISEQYAKLLNLCLELQDEELSSQEAAEKILEITVALRQWL